MKTHSIFLCLAALLVSVSAKNIVPKIQASRTISGRIVGGKPANIGQYPSAAAIYVSTSDGNYFCGGSLISQQFVLSAAHCIIGGVAFRVILGSNTLQGNDPNRKTLSTSIYFVHPNFDLITLASDVGLVKFHIAIDFTDYIKKINLPTVSLIDNLDNTAIGWGQTSDSNSGLNNELHYVTVATISNVECQRSFSNPILDTMVCVAGNLNEGACRGDSGSPLMTTLSNLHWHVGIASFISTSGCETSDPSGYTRTFAHIDWIKTTAEIP